MFTSPGLHALVILRVPDFGHITSLCPEHHFHPLLLISAANHPSRHNSDLLPSANLPTTPPTPGHSAPPLNFCSSHVLTNSLELSYILPGGLSLLCFAELVKSHY